MKAFFRSISLMTLLVTFSVAGLGATGSAFATAPPAGTGSALVRLPGQVPARALANATLLGRLPAATPVSLSFALPLRNQPELDQVLKRLYDPADPLYGHYLTPQQFADSYGPAQADYDAVAAFARGAGLAVTGTHANRILLQVSGSAGQVETAFRLQLHQYQGRDGRKFYAPDSDPAVPEEIAARITGIVGLDNAAVWHPQSTFAPAADLPQATPNQIGTGPGGGLTPNDISTAYNVGGVTANGSGQTLALFELDGYTPSDVAGYASYFGLPAVPLQNVLVDGVSGTAGSGASEVTLDIELQMALAPGAAKILVYEGPNSGQGVIDTYNRIATDNLAKQVSTSWGLSEGQSGSAVLSAENSIFQQMAAQGQSIYAAAGDSGAYDNGSTLSVDDPASQPYMVGVGGTELYVGTGETYSRESCWNVNNTASGGAGGGGVSSVWTIPSWQQGISSAASAGMRNVPDVSLNADQYTGYAIYYQGKWNIFGGTSCASPLWAAFNARVNQQRAANGMPPLGFANPALYQAASGAGYAGNFHDIADGTTNLYYPATAGYDNATGWGSFNGANLLATLSQPALANPPPAPTGLSAVAGNGAVALTWSASSGALSYNVYRGTAPGGEGISPIQSGINATTYTDTVANGVTYYYTVSASNAAGTSAASNEVSATPAAPVLAIAAGPTATVSSTSAQIKWTTNLAADSVVRYGTSSASLSKTASNSSLVTSHALKLSGLSKHTAYYYQVTSAGQGATVSSPVSTFKIP